MKGLLSDRRLVLALRLVLGGVFLYAGIVKLHSPESFAATLAAFRLLPAPFINPVALGLPPLEAAAGILLVTGFRLRLGAFSVLLLCAVFAAALFSALARGLDLDCGCFGHGAWSHSPGPALARDLLLAGMAWIVHRQAPV